MELNHQLTSKLKQLRLSGVLAALEPATGRPSRGSGPTSSFSNACSKMRSNAGPKSSSRCGCGGLPSIPLNVGGLRLAL